MKTALNRIEPPASRRLGFEVAPCSLPWIGIPLWIFSHNFRDYLFIGMIHYVQTLEPYWALPFWILTRSRENMLLPIWIIMRTHDLIYILMKWLPIDFPQCNIKTFFFFLGWHGIRTRDLLILKQPNWPLDHWGLWCKKLILILHNKPYGRKLI